MIYTIGHKKSYYKSREMYGDVFKIGIRDKGDKRFPDGYPGGYAFQTKKDAQKRINEQYPERGFAIFGLDADWEKDTIQIPGEWWHHLKTDARVIFLT